MIGRISSTLAGGAVDGPGIRFVVFMQGCPLRCIYCHNPETWEKAGGIEIDSTVIVEKALRFASYFKSGGGITLSGGEPLLQSAFTLDLLRRCKEKGIHTVLDTSGSLLDTFTEEIISLCDLVLLDVKFTNSEAYSQYTGGDFNTVMHFLSLVESNKTPVWIRQVIIPGINDNEADILRLKALLLGKSCVKKIELLPFRKLCLEKYAALGLPFPLSDTPEASETRIETLSLLLDNVGNWNG